MTVKALAAKTGIPESTIWKWIRAGRLTADRYARPGALYGSSRAAAVELPANAVQLALALRGKIKRGRPARKEVNE